MARPLSNIRQRHALTSLDKRMEREYSDEWIRMYRRCGGSIAPRYGSNRQILIIQGAAHLEAEVGRNATPNCRLAKTPLY